MSWLDHLVELSDGLDEEFGVLATVTPMVARPNQRAAPDPKRRPFNVIGIFHEGHRYAGDTTRASDGLHESKLASTIITFSAPRRCFDYPPTQGDRIEIVELCRNFRIADITFEMPGRTMLVLEALDRLEMS